VHRLTPWLVKRGGDVTIGPVPKGTPIDLIASVQPLGESGDAAADTEHAAKVADLLIKLNGDLASVPKNATDGELLERYGSLATRMLALSKCPDFVVNRGHYFGTAEFNDQKDLSPDEQAFGQEPVLSDDDKRALIAFLKTF
jgi:hypothetical protein